MRLNIDCIRDVLLFIENNQVIFDDEFSNCKKIKEMSFAEILNSPELSNKYNENDLIYTVIQLFKHNYLEGYRIPPNENFIRMAQIDDISPLGHEFLNNVRNNTVWAKTKERLKSIGSVSLQFISSIASEVISDCLKNI